MFLINSYIMARIKKARGRTILDFLHSESQQEPEAQEQPQAQEYPYTRARAQVQVQVQPQPQVQVQPQAQTQVHVQSQEHTHSTDIGSQPEASLSTQLDGTHFIFITIVIFYKINAYHFLTRYIFFSLLSRYFSY